MKQNPSFARSNRRWTLPSRLAMAVALLLVAFASRTFAIVDVPPGLTHDELAQLDVARQVASGDWRLLYPGSYGVEPAYHALLSIAQSIWGTNPLAIHLPSIFGGMLAVVCAYVLARRLFGEVVGLLTLGTIAVVWWPVVLSRVVLREVWTVPLYALALYGFWRGLEAVARHDASRTRRPFVLGGVALGAAQYVHTIPRGLFIVFILFGVYLWIVHRDLFKRAWRDLVVLVIVAEAIAAPLLISAALQPDVDRLPLALYGRPDVGRALIDQLESSVPWILGQFAFAGDSFWHFNIPYRPIFEPLGAVLFGLGWLAALRRWRQPAHAFALIVFAVSLLPSIFLDPHFPFARLSSAQAIAFAFVGLGGEAIGAFLGRVTSSRIQTVSTAALMGGLFAINAIGTAQDLFGVWPSSPGTRSTYNAELRMLGRYLDTLPEPPPISQCTLWIVFLFDPQYQHSVPQSALPYFVQRRDLEVRWHDCRYSLVIPSSGQFLFAHPDLQPLSDFLGRSLRQPWLENARPIPGVDGALQVDARPALAQKLAEWRQLPVSWPPEVSETTPARLPVNFGHALELIGYQVQPGDDVRVITTWRVIAPLTEDVLIFTHLYNTPTEIMAQQDQFDAAANSLKPRDIVIQVHEFIHVPPDTPAGSYWIGTGVYRRDSGERLPIFVGDRRVGDRIFLTQIQVER